MPVGYKSVSLPDYVYAILQKAVNEHRVDSIPEAVNISISMYMGVPYKSLVVLRNELSAKKKWAKHEEAVKSLTDISNSITRGDVRKTEIPEDF